MPFHGPQSPRFSVSSFMPLAHLLFPRPKAEPYALSEVSLCVPAPQSETCSIRGRSKPTPLRLCNQSALITSWHQAKQIMMNEIGVYLGRWRCHPALREAPAESSGCRVWAGEPHFVAIALYQNGKSKIHQHRTATLPRKERKRSPLPGYYFLPTSPTPRKWYVRPCCPPWRCARRLLP